MTPIVIHGRGLAACSCAWLLAEQGRPVVLLGAPPAGAPPLVVNEAAVQLLRECFGLSLAHCPGARPAATRVVCWDGPPSRVAEAAVAVDGGALVGWFTRCLLGRHAGRIAFAPDAAPAPDWTVFATGRRGAVPATVPPPGRLTFGRRHAVCARVASGAEGEVAVELVDGGWLFLAPLGAGEAALFGFVERPPPDPRAALESLLAGGRLVPPLVGELLGEPRASAAAPSLLEPVCGPGWLAVGEAALSVDPLCGDGVGFALRGAILAAAVIRGVEAGKPGCHAHYGRRLALACLAHLRACREFYSQARLGDGWAEELEATDRGASFLSRRSRADGAERYALERTGLVAVGR